MEETVHGTAGQKEKRAGAALRELRARLLPAAFFSAAVFFEEMVLKASAERAAQGLPFLYIALFSLAYGLMLYLVTGIFRGRARLAAAAVITAGCGVLFTVEFFVYRAFKVFYDLNTVTAGAGDAAGEFSDQIAALILCPDGIGHIILFFLPLAVLAVFRKRIVPEERAALRPWFVAAVGTYCLAAFGAFVVSLSPAYAGVYAEEFSFQNAVTDFGLLTGLRGDVERSLFPDAWESGFAAADAAGAGPDTAGPGGTSGALSGEVASAGDGAGDDAGDGAAAAGEAAEGKEAPKVYGYSILDIDYNALAAAPGVKKAHKELDRYVTSLTPSRKNAFTGMFAGKNLIMISAEAFSGYVIDPELTPTLWRLSEKGIRFTDYYQPASAGTTGGEYEHIFGLLPSAGGRSFKMTAQRTNYMTMGWQLDRLGYFGKAYHNNTYTYYDRDKTHTALGYSEGFMGLGNGMEQYVKKVWPESDAEMFEGTAGEYIGREPFNIYYMTVSGHGTYDRASNAMSAKNWDRVTATASDAVRGYIASNLELEDGLKILVDRLEEAGIADDTVICMTADHFPYGLDDDASLGHMPNLSELYGTEVKDYLTRDRNRWILWSGCLEDMDPIEISAPTSSLDILPTLLNLFGIEWDSRLLPGRDVFSDAVPLMFDSGYDWKTERGTFLAGTGRFTPADPSDEVPKEYVESMRLIVRNKVLYCKNVLESDYFEHALGAYYAAKDTPAEEAAGQDAGDAAAAEEEAAGRDAGDAAAAEEEVAGQGAGDAAATPGSAATK